MGLASISWNSVRVFSKLRTRLFRVLYHGARFGTATRIAYAHSIVGTPDLEHQSHKRGCAAQGSPLGVCITWNADRRCGSLTQKNAAKRCYVKHVQLGPELLRTKPLSDHSRSLNIRASSTPDPNHHFAAVKLQIFGDPMSDRPRHSYRRRSRSLHRYGDEGNPQRSFRAVR
jgi:hypothetical protein